MWKNSFNAKNIGLYSKIKVYGLNQNSFIEGLKRRKISIFSVKQISNREMVLSIKYADRKKIFAFSKELCYTIKEIKCYGLFAPLLNLSKNVGLIIGFVLFCVSLIVANNTILKIEYTGTGSVEKEEIQLILNKNGIKRFSSFNDIDLKALSNEIVSNSDKLDFCECTKKGSKIVIESAIRKNIDSNVLSGNVRQIISPCDGIITSIKVYRGRALKGVGDSVKAGELLCDGYMTIKDNNVYTNVVACIVIERQFVYIYKGEKDGEEELAIMYAVNELGDKDTALNPSVTKEKKGNTYIYTVTISYKEIIIKG